MAENFVSASTSLLNDEQRLRIARRHEDSIQRYGYKPQALYWSSKEIQEIRFHMLFDGIPEVLRFGKEFTLLDVGCGFGDLADYLSRHGVSIDYSGIDLAPAMVTAARNLQPQGKFFCGDLFDASFAEESFDFVVLSGALNEVVDSAIEGQTGLYAKAVIAKMFVLSRNGVAFNLLDRRNEWVASRPDLQSFYPQDIVEYCRSFCSHVEWRDDYLDNDFTVYLYK
ncbi:MULTISPECIES: class I SAM-dependent methyltransferase [Thiomicrorhabdus]|uniref:Class I SAM-dependent methyltransferase n=1 Tax=Thiomicrorhabdus heinhorstiae TaxID=2748010 RepID=A0ABS0C0Y6_9GAMM|nr:MULTISPECIES: class I SAM-dependent methyltransferase [Thiomicrorhabdus]MBF6057901.1 class I SAM-dependent methyltransferase [Thiomicrorhabdus heinhorstiae]